MSHCQKIFFFHRKIFFETFFLRQCLQKTMGPGFISNYNFNTVNTQYWHYNFMCRTEVRIQPRRSACKYKFVFFGKKYGACLGKSLSKFFSDFSTIFFVFFFLSFSLEERDAKPSSDVITPKISKLRHKTRKSKTSTIFSAVVNRELAPSPRSRMVYFIT